MRYENRRVRRLLQVLLSGGALGAATALAAPTAKPKTAITTAKKTTPPKTVLPKKAPTPRPSATPSPAPTARPRPAIVLELPRTEDALLLERYRELLAQADKPNQPGRELGNSARIPWIGSMLESLSSKKPVNSATLKGARGYLDWAMPQVEAAATMPTPAAGQIQYSNGELAIDGKLTEPAWARAKTRQIMFNGLKPSEAVPATVKMLWDQQYLYFAFTVPDTNIIAPNLTQDAPVYLYDCVEVFLCPNTRFGTFWELNISPTNGLFDNLLQKYPLRWGDEGRPEETMDGLKIGRNFEGTPNDESDRDVGYSIELAVPFNQLPGFARGGRAGDSVNLMMARVEKDGKNGEPVYLGHVPYVAWFHNIWNYQPFTLVDQPVGP